MITKLIGVEERDAHGNVQLSGTGALGDLLSNEIRKGLGIKRVRSDTFGYLQRSFMGCQSDRDAREAREVGEKAVQFAMWDNVDGSVAIRRPVLDYSVDYELVDIDNVAGKTRHMPDDFINAEGNGVTEDFKNYCRPLLGSEPAGTAPPARAEGAEDPAQVKLERGDCSARVNSSSGEMSSAFPRSIISPRGARRRKLITNVRDSQEMQGWPGAKFIGSK